MTLEQLITLSNDPNRQAVLAALREEYEQEAPCPVVIKSAWLWLRATRQQIVEAK